MIVLGSAWEDLTGRITIVTHKACDPGRGYVHAGENPEVEPESPDTVYPCAVCGVPLPLMG